MESMVKPAPPRSMIQVRLRYFASGAYLSDKLGQLLAFLTVPLPMPKDRLGLDRWLDEALGRTLIAAEAVLLAEAYEDVFGWDLLQLGAWGPGSSLIAASRTRRQTIVTQQPPRAEAPATTATAGAIGATAPPDPFIVARLAQLPIGNGSVDAVLIPHTLEFETDPYAIVREADRVLAGDGQLIVLGFRPLSLWGLRAAVTRAGFPPGLRRLIPLHRLRDWLVLLGYEIVESRSYLYHSPWGAPRAGEEGRAQVLRPALLNPFPAAGYLVKARKRLYTLTPVRPRFREKRTVLGGLVEPTSRSRS
jgi:SAM-dependent methyltransferase